MNNLATNCRNCGAVMEYSKQYYGSMYKCPFCGTEHHIDLLGRIEEYKVKFMFQGRLIEAYLSSIDYEYPEVETYRYLDGTLSYIRTNPIMEFKFIGTAIKELDEKVKE